MSKSSTPLTARFFAVAADLKEPRGIDAKLFEGRNDVDQAWLARMAPRFAEFGATPPRELREIYPTVVNDDDMLDMLLEQRPEMVSFHFGLPGQERIDALKS
ncbi:MAG: hypothetical protein HYZ18_15380, partial [Pseudogulbenkiania sp.]|nr:hypothetical protein [Pseudogulbenkiania sp.]